MTDYTRSADGSAWYFGSKLASKQADVARTQTITRATVMIDWGYGGDVLGVEVLCEPDGELN